MHYIIDMQTTQRTQYQFGYEEGVRRWTNADDSSRERMTDTADAAASEPVDDYAEGFHAAILDLSAAEDWRDDPCYNDEPPGDGDLARLLDQIPPHTTRLRYSRLGPGWQCECARCGRFGPHFSVEQDAIKVAQQHQERPGFPASGLDYGSGCPTC